MNNKKLNDVSSEVVVRALNTVHEVLAWDCPKNLKSRMTDLLLHYCTNGDTDVEQRCEMNGLYTAIVDFLDNISDMDRKEIKSFNENFAKSF